MADYAPIRVSTLRGDQKIPFDAYVHVAGRYILLCRQGDSFEGDRLDRLRGKKLSKMFILPDHQKAYDLYMHENIERAYSGSQGKPLEIRTQIIHGALQAAAEDLIEDPASSKFYEVAIEGARRFKGFLRSELQALEHLLNFKNIDFNVAHHGVIVAALALAIIDESGLAETSPMQVDPMLVGCFIHDLEHNYNNVNRSVPPRLLGKGELRVYKEHSVAGHERIKAFAHFDPLVREIVLNHEEKIDGSGPRQKREKDIEPIILAMSAANEFDLSLTYENASPKEILKKFLIDKMGLLKLEQMHSLQNVLKKRGLI